MPSIKSIVFLHFLLFINLHVTAQTTLGTSVFQLAEKDNLGIGFLSFDISYPVYEGEFFAFKSGMRINGAFEGNRGGYFAFGYFGEGILMAKRPYQLGWNFSLTAGGGAQAPDKDGWMIQNTLFAQYTTSNNFSIRAGINHAYVSSGILQGFSPLIGLNWALRHNLRDSAAKNTFNWNAIYPEIGFGRFGKLELGFIGSGASYNIGHYFGGDVAFHALINTHGGYMQCISSIGPLLNLNHFSINPSAVIGLGGGGAIQTKGGGLYGAQIGIQYHGKNWFSGLKYQHVWAVSKLFQYDAAFLAIGKTLRAETNFEWYPIIKHYVGKTEFGNIGARFCAYESNYLALYGSTYWAYTNNRGAYAEGLFELTLKPFQTIPVYVVLSGGAGAGASINKKTASGIVSAGIGFFSPWKKCPVGVEFAYWQGGNIPPWSAAIYYRLFQRKFKDTYK